MENFNSYELSIENLRYNVDKIRSFVGDSKICAMVKADGYGHGATVITKAIEDKVDFFGVASVFEAQELRDAGIKNKILIVGKIPLSCFEWCAENDVSVTVSSVKEMRQVCDLIHRRLSVHVKVNTGMNRFGINSVEELKKIKKLFSAHPNIIFEGMFTHFATKAEDVVFLDAQHVLFDKYIKLVDKNVIIHCASTYATSQHGLFKHDMVRCGFAIYGWGEGFKPVLSIKSKIISIHDVKRGDSVGYDRTFVFNDKGKVGVVPIGYADGFDRRLSNNFKVLINGCYVDVIGRICMDVFMVDLSTVKNVQEGDVVTVLGSDGKNGISVYDYAEALDTSPYEILLKFRPHRMKTVLK